MDSVSRTASSDRRMAVHAAWNYAALAVTVAVGAATTFLIARQMGATALGVFAQLYAIHAIGAQIAVFGVHDSTQKHVADLSADGRPDAAAIDGALRFVLVSALLLAAVLAMLAGPIGLLVSSDAVGRGLYLVAPGIVFFALNKVLFGAINGRGTLKLYAGMQIVRAAFVLAAIAAIVTFSAPVYAVGGIFTAAEALLFPCLLLAVRPSFRRDPGTGDLPWWRRHFAFGGRGLLAAVLVETHLRIDVAMLSYFASDRDIGIYAFASLFAEGVFQLPVVLRTVAYPTIVQLAARADRAGVARMARRLSLASGALSIATALIVAFAYPYIAGRFDAGFVTPGSSVLFVLLAGMSICAFVVPFDQLLLQSGQPGRQSALMAAYVGANIVLNLLLIPPFGLLGAAVATAISLALAGVLLLVASRVWLGYRPSVLTHRTPA
jgi:O-antigen/teichoic acid export membrane protein